MRTPSKKFVAGVGMRLICTNDMAAVMNYLCTGAAYVDSLFNDGSAP